MKNIRAIQVVVLLVWHLMCYLIDDLFEDYDKSLNKDSKDSMLNHTTRWDSAFFLENAINGYRYEKNHAFLPGFPLIVRAFATVSPEYYLLLTLIVIEVQNLLSAWLIYKITLMVKLDKQVAQLSTLCFIFTPGSVFFHSLYSESLYMLITLVGLYVFYSLTHKLVLQTILSSIIFGLTISVRSTGLLYIAVSGYPILHSSIVELLKRDTKQFLRKFSTYHLPLALAVVVCFALPYSLILYYPNSIYCRGEDPAPWCDSLIPDVYGFIQDKHWQVGFLRSYTPRRAIFIFWGSFGVIVMGIGLIKQARKGLQLLNDPTTPILISQTLLFLITSLIAHVNCSTRFFSSTIMFYWVLAEFLLKKNAQFSKFQVFVLFYIVYFNIAGMVQFTNYLIWA